jgi:Uma2 family endonuclease
MTSTAKKLDTIDDLLALPSDVRADLIGEQIEQRAMPSFQHEDIVGSLLTELRVHFRGPKNPSGSGGWWINSSTLIRFGGGKALCPDLAGWRRDRVPEKPSGFPVAVLPDWVCEVSLSTRKKDTTQVPALLHANQVPWYWRLDVEDEALFVYEYSEKGYVQTMCLFRDDGKVRIPPFEAIELSMPVLFGDDPEDE